MVDLSPWAVIEGFNIFGKLTRQGEDMCRPPKMDRTVIPLSSSSPRYVWQRRLRILTLSTRVANHALEVFAHANAEAVLVMLVHKIGRCRPLLLNCSQTDRLHTWDGCEAMPILQPHEGQFWLFKGPTNLLRRLRQKSSSYLCYPHRNTPLHVCSQPLLARNVAQACVA